MIYVRAWMCKRGNFIRDWLYRLIVRFMPIACVDLLITCNNDSEILLVKRATEPAYGLWWMPGGRVILEDLMAQGFGDRLSGLQKTVARLTRTELGVELKPVKQVGTYVTSFFTSRYPNVGTRTTNTVLLCHIEKRQGFLLHSSLDAMLWTTPDSIINSADFDPYIRTVVRDALL